MVTKIRNRNKLVVLNIYISDILKLREWVIMIFSVGQFWGNGYCRSLAFIAPSDFQSNSFRKISNAH